MVELFLQKCHNYISDTEQKQVAQQRVVLYNNRLSKPLHRKIKAEVVINWGRKHFALSYIPAYITQSYHNIASPHIVDQPCNINT